MMIVDSIESKLSYLYCILSLLYIVHAWIIYDYFLEPRPERCWMQEKPQSLYKPIFSFLNSIASKCHM